MKGAREKKKKKKKKMKERTRSAKNNKTPSLFPQK
jgi:hypothetical protein